MKNTASQRLSTDSHPCQDGTQGVSLLPLWVSRNTEKPPWALSTHTLLPSSCRYSLFQLLWNTFAWAHAGEGIQNKLAQHAWARHVFLGRKHKNESTTRHALDSLVGWQLFSRAFQLSAEHFYLWAFSCHLLEVLIDSFSCHRISVLVFSNQYWYHWPLDTRDFLAFIVYCLAGWI